MDRRSDIRFGIWDLPQKVTTKAKFGPLGQNRDFFGTFWGLLVAIFTKIWYYTAKLTQEEKGFKKHVVATLSAKSGLIEDHFRTFTGQKYAYVAIQPKIFFKPSYINVHGKKNIYKEDLVGRQDSPQPGVSWNWLDRALHKKKDPCILFSAIYRNFWNTLTGLAAPGIFCALQIKKRSVT